MPALSNPILSVRSAQETGTDCPLPSTCAECSLSATLILRKMSSTCGYRCTVRTLHPVSLVRPFLTAHDQLCRPTVFPRRAYQSAWRPRQTLRDNRRCVPRESGVRAIRTLGRETVTTPDQKAALHSFHNCFCIICRRDLAIHYSSAKLDLFPAGV